MVTPRRRLTIQEREKGLPSRCALRRCYYYSEIRNINEYKPLKEMGFDLYDVVRDGHCGYYSLLLAQRMYGLSVHNPPDEKIGFLHVMVMRTSLYHKMQKHGEKLFENIHVTSDDDATEADKEFHSYFNSMFGMENFEDISRTFWDEDSTNPKERYRHVLKKEHLHMAVDYGPLLFAVFFKVPVAQITLYQNPEGDCWNTLYVDGTTYDSENHTVAVDFSFGIQTYKDYPNMPVVYLLFENNHYMLLEQPRDGFKVTVKDRKGNNSREALVCVNHNAMRNPPTSDNDNRKNPPVPEKAVTASAVRLETGNESEGSETGHQSERSCSEGSSDKEKTAAKEKRQADERADAEKKRQADERTDAEKKRQADERTDAEKKRQADERTDAEKRRQADERTDPTTSDNAGFPKIGGRPPTQPNPIGAPGDMDAPRNLQSNVWTRFTQGESYNCLAYSLSSALHYCGFPTPALWMWEQAGVWSRLPVDQALQMVSSFMRSVVPSIGGTTKFMCRTARKRKRYLTIQDVIELSPTPYPWLIIPRREDGATDHALCVVDDLIFDAITPKALHLCQESFKWIFNDRPITIHRAIRFDQNLLPKGSGNRYTRECQFHGRGGYGKRSKIA